MSIKAPEKPKPNVQTKAIQQQAAPSALTALKKTAPTIIRPAENERFGKPGPVSISAQVSAADASLIWEIEHQAFGAASFLRQQPAIAGAPAAGAGTVKTARLDFAAPGTYRFRIKEDGTQWSRWRTVIVGSPASVEPAAKTLQLKSKPTPATDALKSPQEQPTQPLSQPAQKKFQPVTIKKPTAPIAAPRQ